MTMDFSDAPLYDALKQLSEQKPVSFHVPGHKNGEVFSSRGKHLFSSILSIDLTELSGLDDLHAPVGVIKQAQELAAQWFGSIHTYFLVGGSTVGNLAMIMATCAMNGKVIVQRNCHKSIFNGLELSNATPIFVAPEYDEEVDRYCSPRIDTVKQAIDMHKDAKAVVLTYPDYYGRTYDLEPIITYAHRYGIPVLIDEAHGVHFRVSNLFPKSALDLGADMVVQSAHKTAPAMTMASYLHINSTRVSTSVVEHYLQMLQSSSPSYPLMASLDLARKFLAEIDEVQIDLLRQSINTIRTSFAKGEFWKLINLKNGIDDPLKITLQTRNGYSGSKIAREFEKMGLYPELASHNQILFIHGLQPYKEGCRLAKAIEKMNEQLKIQPNHATIESRNMFNKSITQLVYSYQQMRHKNRQFIPLEQAEGRVVAEAIIPYPPGIPMLTKGEPITKEHLESIRYLLDQGTTFQNQRIHQGIVVFV